MAGPDREAAADEVLAEPRRTDQPGGIDIEDLCASYPEFEGDLRAAYQSWKRAPRAEAGFGSEAAARPDPNCSDVTFCQEAIERLSDRRRGATRYRDVAVIGQGGMGTVRKVWDADLRRHLAMKVVTEAAHPEAPAEARRLARFLEEAQVTGQLDHPGIVPVHEVGLDAEGNCYFTMKYVKGETLLEIFERARANERSWTLVRALGILLKVCEAMSYAHTKGVVHRDLKPANVMVGRFGEVYVMDWGLARVLGVRDRHDVRIRAQDGTRPSVVVDSERRSQSDESRGEQLFTLDGDVLGTPAYMAPEQARGEIDEISPRSDVYSVGALLYHLLTGQVPFIPPGCRLSARSVLVRLLEGPPRSVEQLSPTAPPEVIAICERAMERDPSKRYPGMLELSEDLRAFLENRVVQAYRRGRLAELGKWVQRNRGLVGASTAAVVTMVLGTWGASWFAGEARAKEAEVLNERARVTLLSAFQRIDEMEAEADLLWPPLPSLMGKYRDWLRRAESLLAELDYGPMLSVIRDRARQRAERTDKRELALERHPDYATYALLSAKLAALLHAQAVREGHATVERPPVPDELVGRDVRTMGRRGSLFTDLERTIFGREAEGLAILEQAAVRIEEGTGSHQIANLNVLRLLGMAYFANGLDAEALAKLEETEALAPGRYRKEYERATRELRHQVATASDKIVAVQEQRAGLLDRMESSLEWAVADPVDAWWHERLTRLIPRIEQFQVSVSGENGRSGWGVRKRLELARSLEERTITSSDAALRWGEALDGVSSSEHYGGLGLPPQLGLLPLGPDPESGLWEFVHVLSGEDVERDATGRLSIAPESGIVLVLVPGGEFWMGSQRRQFLDINYDPEGPYDARPPHEVVLHPYFISKYEMTQAQWGRVLGQNPSGCADGSESAGAAVTSLNPVENVSWKSCARVLGYLGLVLPTEAQWECAARGGQGTPWSTGSDKESLAGYANIADVTGGRVSGIWPVVEEWLDDGHHVHAPVGSFLPNPFGLHDVHGNVQEWCRDWFQERYLAPIQGGDGERVVRKSEVDWTYPRLGPAVHQARDHRVKRGGSFMDDASASRSSVRSFERADFEAPNLGVRPARAVEWGERAAGDF